jgi:hypothetical protein
MPEIQRVKDLEIAEDLAFQERSWVVQRVGWVVMGLLALAGLLGLLGAGLLSGAKAGEPGDPLWLEYDRFERFQSPTQLQVHFIPKQVGQVRIWLDRDYLEQVQLQQVSPQPLRVEAAADHWVYVFRATQPNQATAVTFFFQPQHIGSLSGSIGLEAQETLDFSQFVYP